MMSAVKTIPFRRRGLSLTDMAVDAAMLGKAAGPALGHGPRFA
jgi:hypothetical protein